MTIREWPGRRWAAAVLGAVASALVIGVPSGIVRTPFYERMTPVQWWSYPVWVITALLSGLILATYLRTSAAPGRREPATSIGGSVLSLFAVGCPVCNKIVVALVGVTGALNLWAPLQPILGIISVALLGWALRRRLAGERACPARTPVSLTNGSGLAGRDAMDRGKD